MVFDLKIYFVNIITKFLKAKYINKNKNIIIIIIIILYLILILNFIFLLNTIAILIPLS